MMINILSSQSYNYLKQNLLKSGRFSDIEVETKTFPDGERYFRIINSYQISGNPAVYICGTVDDEAILETYHICSTLVREGCSALHLVIPYFGYSTMERARLSGEVVSAKNIACLLGSIPNSPQGNYIYMVDLHTETMQYYFDQNVYPVHLSTDPIIDMIISDIKRKSKKLVLASTDMGRAKWVEEISSRLDIGGAYIMKRRFSGSETAVEAINADVQNKNVIIFDDMIRSGSSVIHAAIAYKSAGAKDIFVVCAHGVFVDGAIEKLKNSGIIKAIYCTNTHCRTEALRDSFVKIYDMSDVILKGLRL